MWVRSSITVGHESVGLEVRRLEHGARERAAARIAWFTHTELESAENASDDAWQSSVQGLVGDECYRVQAADGRERSDDWWHEAGRRAAAEFVRVNELAEVLRRFHEGLSRAGVPTRQG